MIIETLKQSLSSDLAPTLALITGAFAASSKRGFSGRAPRPPITAPVALGTFTRGQVGATNQFTFTTSAAIPVGTLALVAIGMNGAGTPVTVSSVSDGVNNYTRATSTNSGSDLVELWYVANAAARASGSTITITFSATYGGSGYGTASAAYVPNVATVTPLDKIAAQATTGTTPSISTGTLTNANEIVIGVSFNDDSNPSFTEDAGNGWTNTNLTGSAAGSRSALSYIIVSTTASKSWAPVWGTSGTLLSLLASFKN